MFSGGRERVHREQKVKVETEPHTQQYWGKNAAHVSNVIFLQNFNLESS